VYITPTVGPGGNQTLPQGYVKRLFGLCKDEFQHLIEGEAEIRFLLATEPVTQHGRRILGAVHLPQVQGRLRGVFTWLLGRHFGVLPDFLVILDEAYWLIAEDRAREALIYHELSHMGHAKDKDGDPRYDDDGRPVWCLVGHDVEEFHSVARRYGAHSMELKVLQAALEAGDADDARRGRGAA